MLADVERARRGTDRSVLFLGFMAAFAIKAPLFPFHTWLPDVHTEAPTAGSVVLAGVILKMGAYGFLRFSFELFPQASVDFAPILLMLAVIGIIYGAIVAAMQTDLKRVIAYSSVAHMGFVVLGIFSLTVHRPRRRACSRWSQPPLTTGALFLVVGMLYERRHTREIIDVSAASGSRRRSSAALFLIAMFAAIGLPGFSGFVGEFLVAARHVRRAPLVGGRRDHRRDPRPRCTCCGCSSGCSPACPRARTPSMQRRHRSARCIVVVPLLGADRCSSASTRSRCSTASSRRSSASCAHFERKTDYREPDAADDREADPATVEPEGDAAEDDDGSR